MLPSAKNPISQATGRDTSRPTIYRHMSTHPMTGRRRQRRDGNPYDPLALTIADAVKAASDAADEAGLAAPHTVSGRSGIGAVFAAAMAAVAETEPGNIGPSVFDAALRAARGALADSSIPSNYDRIRRAVTSIPDRLVWAAARRAAVDRFARMPAGARTAGDARLLSRMRTAAVRAAKSHLGRDGHLPAVRAAAQGAREIADGAARITSEIVLVGAPVYAATTAVFEVAIRGVPPGKLADAVEEAYRDLPEMACRHDDMVVSFVAALSEMIAADAAYRRKYQTAVRGAEELARNEAAGQIVNMITDNAFEVVYMALVASAYATTSESYFGSGYQNALAEACGIDPRRYRLAGTGGIAEGAFPGAMDDIPEDVPVEVAQELYQRLSGAMDRLMASEEEFARQRMFRNALDIDYEAAASLDSMGGIISLYETAYRAGYEGAGRIAAKGTGGYTRRR